MIYDVIVSGAGPAGSLLAHHLAQAGLNVVMVEKAALPRYKPCGGGLPLKTIRSLPFDVGPVLEREARTAVLQFAGRELLRTPLADRWGWFAMRDRFDQWLVQRAVQAGAELWEGLALRGVRDGPAYVEVRAEGQGRPGAPVVEQARGRFLAGADGVLSTVARTVGLLPQRRVGVAIEAEIQVGPRALEQHGTSATFDFGALPQGYGWIFPKSEHLSVGLFRAWPGKAPRLRDRLGLFLANHRELQNGHTIQQRGHLIPLGGSREPLHRGRVLLLGDAANLADPWLGEGIYYAVQSAVIAADVLTAAVESGPDTLARYSARVHAEILPDLRQARHLAAVIYRQPRLCSMLLTRSAILQQLVFGAIRGDLALRQLGRRATWKLPQILLQAIQRGENPA
jgi:geranylgeranyl reductase family protein